jgi:inhibitor of cysteine peptidase
LVLLSVAIPSDGAQQSSAGAKAKSSVPTVTITEQDNGKDIDLTTGAVLIVKLPSNPSTGYRWSVAGDPAPLKLERTSFSKGAPKSGALGASGISIFRLSASSAGLSNLTLLYRRSWEYNIAPAKSFSVRVDVR